MSQIAPPMTADAADALFRGWPDEAKRLLLNSLLRAGVVADAPPPASWRTGKVVPPVLTEEEIADDLRAMEERPDDTFDPMELEDELRRTGQG
jgi:hypothetical protein